MGGRKSQEKTVKHFCGFVWQGHLLVLENFNSLNLNHGLMEVGYVNHESAVLSSTTSDSRTGYDDTASISMTATMDMSGRLVLGKLLFLISLCA